MESTNVSLSVVRVVDGWPLDVTNSEDPRVRDVDLAERLGFAEPRMIRKLVKRMMDDQELIGVHVRSTVERTSMPRGGERETAVTEYWLTEEDALILASRSDAPKAKEVRRALVRVFMAWRRGLLVPPAPAKPMLTASERGKLGARALADKRRAELRDMIREAVREAIDEKLRAPTHKEIGKEVFELADRLGAVAANLAGIVTRHDPRHLIEKLK